MVQNTRYNNCLHVRYSIWYTKSLCVFIFQLMKQHINTKIFIKITFRTAITNLHFYVNSVVLCITPMEI